MKSEEKDQQIDISKLSLAQADALSAEIGREISKIMDEANLKCNAILNIYGLQTEIGYKIVEIDEKTGKKAKSKDLSES